MDMQGLMDASLVEGLALRQEASGVVVLDLQEPLGCGTMCALPVLPAFLPAVVDFRCERCPNAAEVAFAPGEGRWLTVNLCLEGRCEVSIPREGYAVVKAGDCCVSCTDELPQDYRYPLRRYRGIELFLHTSLDMAAGAFALFEEAGGSLERLAQDAGLAAVFSGDPMLNAPLERIGEAVEAYRAGALGWKVASVRCRYELVGFLLAILERDVLHAQPRSLLTPSQLALARKVHDELEGALFAEHDARDLAERYDISAATLNRYFSDLYGCTIACYLRRRRMEEAAGLLREGMSVADAAIRVGYSNPSKFAAAFKREMGVTPTEHKRSSCIKGTRDDAGR